MLNHKLLVHYSYLQLDPPLKPNYNLIKKVIMPTPPSNL